MWWAWWAACGGNDDDGPATIPNDDTSTPTVVDPTPPTGCDPTLDEVDVVAIAADPVPKQSFGRRFTVTLSGDAGAIVACTLDAAPPGWVQWIPLLDRWQYLDRGDPGPDFANPDFDDSGWDAGPGPFGREDVVGTEVGPREVVWFRNTFEVSSVSDINAIRAAYRRDDGVVVYVNGTEAFRDNVPTDLAVSGNDERTLQTASLDPGLFVVGSNTVAVELHQSPESTDLGFDLRLSALIGGAPPEEVLLVEDPAAANEHTLTLYGLLANATYTCEARSTACGGDRASVEVVTPELAAPTPTMALRPGGAAPAWGDYTLFNHQRPCGGNYGNRLFIIDPDGRARWHTALGLEADSTIDLEAQFLPDGTILWGGGAQPEGYPHIVGLDGEAVYDASYPGRADDVYHHDLEYLANGRIMGLVEGWVDAGDDGWTGFGLVEHDPATGEVTWEWKTQEAFDRGELPPAAIDDSDPYHANALAVVDDADGEGVYVSLLNTNEVVRIDRESGRITWHLGVGGEFDLVDPSGEALPTEEWFDRLHGINVFDGRLFLYENGWGPARSRALAFTLDAANRTASLDWTYEEPTWYEPIWGDVDELPDGDAVLIDMAHAYCHGASLDHPGALVEVSQATGNIGWRVDFLDADDASYRAQRIEGCAWFPNSRYCPAVAARLEALGP